MEVFPGISMDAKIRFGKPCIAGTRIDVATVLGGLASGASVEELASEYQLTRERFPPLSIRSSCGGAPGGRKRMKISR